MYNNFIREQQKNQERKIQQHEQRELKWKKKYQLKILPTLLDHYDKRITSFIHQADENPIIVDSQVSCRQQSFKKFVFRDNEDWRSLRCPREREEMSYHKKYETQKLKVQKTQAKQPESSKQQFRRRSKEKEIHPPMVFNDRPQSSILSERKLRLTSKSPKKEKNVCFKEQGEGMSASFRRNPSRATLISTHHTPFSSKNEHYHDFDSLREGKDENIEIEALIYEKGQQLVEKKLHFKKLMDLSLKNRNSEIRREYRKILQKCGYSKMKKHACSTEGEEYDNFHFIVESSAKTGEQK